MKTHVASRLGCLAFALLVLPTTSAASVEFKAGTFRLRFGDDGRQEVILRVRPTPHYLAFRVERVRGIPTDRGTSLHFVLNADARVHVTELDYMTRVQNERYGVRVHWDSFWHRVDEKLPHPRVDGAWELKRLPEWSCGVDMTASRGIGMRVTGDGSGALLLFQIPGRDYVLPIDFTGPRDVEIPNGEVAWADGRWGWRMETKRTDYAHVRWCRLGFGCVPPGGKASVLVEGFWNKVRDLPVEKKGYVMPRDRAPVSISVERSNVKPWLEVQFMTEGGR